MAGYKTILAGRMHFIGRDQYHGFEERLVGDISSGFIGYNRAIYRYRGYHSLRESISNPGPGSSLCQSFDQTVAMAACQAIYNHEVSGDPRPLCLVVSFFGPHDPFRVHAKYYNQYSKKSDLPFNYKGQRLHSICD